MKLSPLVWLVTKALQSTNRRLSSDTAISLQDFLILPMLRFSTYFILKATIVLFCVSFEDTVLAFKKCAVNTVLPELCILWSVVEDQEKTLTLITNQRWWRNTSPVCVVSPPLDLTFFMLWMFNLLIHIGDIMLLIRVTASSVFRPCISSPKSLPTQLVTMHYKHLQFTLLFLCLCFYCMLKSLSLLTENIYPLQAIITVIIKYLN